MFGGGFEQLNRAILEGALEETEDLVKRMLEEGVNPLEVMNKGCIPAMEKAGELFEAEEFFLPELIMASEAMKRAVKLLEPELAKRGTEKKIIGRVVIGTVEGDVHDIGKSIVASMLSAAGFEVYDLGVDVPGETFVARVKEVEADILGLSALLTTTMQRQREVIELLTEKGMRDKVKLIVGGAPVTRAWAEKIGADGYAEDAVNAVKVAREMIATK